MPSFGKRSLTSLATCDERLQRVAQRAILLSDFTVLEGHRGQAAQEAAFDAGLSRAHFGQSAHNANPSRAFDVAPYPIDWSDNHRFIDLSDHMLAAAHAVGVEIVWGGTFWGGTRAHPTDSGHYELAT